MGKANLVKQVLVAGKSPRFALLGRHGDIARVVQRFVSYQKLRAIVDERFAYQGPKQLWLYGGQPKN